MSQKLKNLISNTTSERAPEYLKLRILAEIERLSESQRLSRRRLMLAGLLTSLILSFISIAAAFKDLLQSDFWQVFSLAFTDLAVIGGNWQEFFLSLEETFPFESAILMLLPIFILVIFLAFYIDNIKRNFPGNRHGHA